MQTIPIAALFDNASGERQQSHCRKLLARADVIIAWDASTQREFTVFGTPALEETARADGPQALRTVRVGLDQHSRELDRLLTLVKDLKHLHVGSSGTAERPNG